MATLERGVSPVNYKNTKFRVPGFREGHHSVRRVTEALTGFLGHIEFFPGSKDSLQRGRELWKAGMETWVVARHNTDADGPLIGEALGPEMARAAFFLMGDRVLKKRVRGFFASSYSQVPIPQIADPTKDNGCRDPQEDRRLLIQANEAIPALLRSGRIAKLFPEGSRSRNGILQPVQYQIAHFLNENAFVIPMAFIGARERWPVEKFPKLISRDRVTINVGTPILIKDVLEEIRQFKEERGIRISKKEEQGLIMEVVMRRGIAPLVAPRDRGIYSNMWLVEEILPIVQQRLAEEAAKRNQRQV